MGLSEDIEFLRFQLDRKLSFEEDSLTVALIVQAYIGGGLSFISVPDKQHWFNHIDKVEIDLCAYKFGEPLYQEGHCVTLADIPAEAKLEASMIFLEILDGVETPEAPIADWDAKSLTKRIKDRAEDRKVPFHLTKQILEEELQKSNCCPVCEHRYTKKANHPHYPSVDRLLPNLGYTDVNIVVMCRRCNSKKGDATCPEDLRKAGEWVLALWFEETLKKRGLQVLSKQETEEKRPPLKPKPKKPGRRRWKNGSRGKSNKRPREF